MSYTTSSSITRKDLDKATLIFSIDNFAQAKNDKKSGQGLKSETFSIGASKFFLKIHPSGEIDGDQGFVSVFLRNASEHKVTVDYIMSIGTKEYSCESRVMKPGMGVGYTQFMKVSEVGQNVKVTADVTLVKEEILDGLPGGLSLTDWQFLKKSDADNQQKMELRLVQKLEQKIEQTMEKKLEENLNNKHNDLKRKIHDEFEDLKEDIKAPARAPECPICFEELRPPMQIIQCLRGHKLCEPCSLKPEIPCCPDGCKAGFMGRDFGMEAFILKQFQTRFVCTS